MLKPLERLSFLTIGQWSSRILAPFLTYRAMVGRLGNLEGHVMRGFCRWQYATAGEEVPFGSGIPIANLKPRRISTS